MLRISPITPSATSPDAQVLKLDGTVTGPWVEELRRACLDALGNKPSGHGHLVTDLAGVSFIDADGLSLFRELSTLGVVCINGSAFIAEQLKEVCDGVRGR